MIHPARISRRNKKYSPLHETLRCTKSMLLLAWGWSFVVLVFVVARCHFGLYWSDETYIVSEMVAFSNNARPLIDSWSITQFFNLLWEPVIKLHRLCFGNNGLILFLRLLFCLCQYGVGLYTIYVLGKHFSLRVGLLSFTLFMLFAPLTIYTFSYNNVAFSGFWTAILSLFDAMNRQSGRRFALALAGLSASIAVIAYPPMLIGAIVLLIYLFASRNRQRGDFALVLPFAFFLPIVIIGKLIFSSGITETLINFPKMVSAEAAASTANAVAHVLSGSKLLQFLQGITGYTYWGRAVPLRIAIPLMVIALCALRYARRLSERLRFIGFCLVCPLFLAAYAWLLRFQVTAMNLFGYIVWLLCVLLLLLLSDRETARRLAPPWIVFPAFLGLLSHLFSNVGFPSAATFLLLSAIPLSVLLDRIARRVAVVPSRVVFLSFAAALCLTLMWMRVSTDYMNHFEHSMHAVQSLSVRLESGSGAGIRVTPERAAVYQTMQADLSLDVSSDDRLAVVCCLPWAYLSSAAKPAAPTLWAIFPEQELTLEYYAMHPEHTPTAFLLIKPEIDLIPYAEKGSALFTFLDENYVPHAERAYYTLYRLKPPLPL